MTVRVDDETRILMESLEGVNGSEILRERILEGLERETRRNRMDALRIMERLYRRPHPGWDSTKFIRAMRESRYGPGRRRR